MRRVRVPVRMTGRLAAGMAALVLSACGRVADAPACDPLLEGIPVAAQRGAGEWARRGVTPELVELWRRGGTREGEELAFPFLPAASHGGRLAIPDFVLGEVIVIEPDGTWLGAWARPGDGPGEIATPAAAAWAADGTLVVFDIVRSAVVRLRDGEPAGPEVGVDPAFVAPILRAGEFAWAGVRPDGTVFLSPGWARIESTDGGPALLAAILRLPAGGTESDTLARSIMPALPPGEGRGPWPVPGVPRPAAATGASGGLAWTPGDGTYRVLISDASGRLRQICRDAPPLPLTAAERGDSVPEGMDELAAAIREAEPPARPAPIGRVILGARGRLWVERDRPPAFPGSGTGLHGRPGALHDVFEADGGYLGEVRMPDDAALQAARGDTVWAFEFGEFDETWVVAFELRVREGAS